MPRSCSPKVVAALAGGSLLASLLSAVPSTPAAAEPGLSASTVASGLTVPWDLTWIGSTLLFNERGGQIWTKTGDAAAQRVTATGGRAVLASSEGGLHGMVAHPTASSNKYFYTCAATGSSTSDSTRDVRVQRWVLTSATQATFDKTIVDGMPHSSGRHSGCRLRFGLDGKLYVATGDAAQGTNPQNLNSLGGKVLRVNDDGTLPADNPFVARRGDARYVWTYGHRNLQGLVQRPGTGEFWSAEHGPDRDDEINVISRGANYGWDPVPGYNEQVPMTDTRKFPSARVARWSSGQSTVATSGATFLTGGGWGGLQGALAVGLLKETGIQIHRLRPDGTVASTSRLAAAENIYGRIRTTQLGPDGALYFTTSNGGGNDRIVRLAPTTRPTAYSAGLDVSPVGVSAARTGRAISVFARSTDDRVFVKRSTDDGATWPGWWTYTGVTSASAPSATSSASGRVDLLTRTGSGVRHTWFVNGVRAGQTDLAGIVTAAPAVSSVGDGTLDVLVRSSGDRVYRKQYVGGRWDTWRSLGGVATSTIGASANLSTKATRLTIRGADGYAYERIITPTSDGGDWVANRALSLYSARALGDVRTGVGLVGVSSSADDEAVVDRGSLIMGIRAGYDSAPDVVTREDGTWMMFGRATNGHAYAYDARPGGYRNIYLAGIVR